MTRKRQIFLLLPISFHCIMNVIEPPPEPEQPAAAEAKEEEKKEEEEAPPPPPPPKKPSSQSQTNIEYKASFLYSKLNNN